MLDELDRVLAPGGVFVLVGPNWSGPHNAIRAALQLCRGADRYWHYESLWQAGVGLLRSVRLGPQGPRRAPAPLPADRAQDARRQRSIFVTRMTTRYICVIRCRSASGLLLAVTRSCTSIASDPVARHVERAVSESRDVERVGVSQVRPALAVTIVVSRSAADVCVGLSGARSANA